ncbi:MAG: hypothetical protein HGA66_01085 [Holophaga sp.]|nr:hypothetical protein [Holophaga sp.]
MTGAASRPVSLEELLDAEEVFLVGTSAEVTPLRALDDRQWTPGPRTLEVQALYHAAVRGQTADAEGWLSY